MARHDQADEEAMGAFASARKLRWEATKACIQVTVFFIFLMLYSSIIMLESDTFERYFQQTITDHFSMQFQAKLPPKEVRAIDQFWDYLENGLLKAAYGNTSTLGIPQTDVPLLPALGGDEFLSNRILGAIQMRALKVNKGSRGGTERGCGSQSAYDDYFTSCVPAYSSYTELDRDFGDGGQQFVYSAEVSTPMNGLYADYSGGGFVEKLSANESYTREKILELKEDQWLDMQTRAVIIDLNTWNPNIEMYGIVRLMFEISPVGLWNFDARVLLLKPRYLSAFGNGSSGEWIMTICDACIALFCLYYVAEEVSEFWVSFYDYVQDGWNLIDWATLVLLLVAFAMKVMNFSSNIKPGLEESTNSAAYTDLQLYAERMYTVRKIYSFNSVLIWVKIVKYVPFLPYARVLKELFAMSGALFMCFVCLFVIFFVGFGLAFCVGFGMDLEELQSWPVSWVYLGRTLLGDVDVSPIYRIAPIAGSVLLAMFVVGVYMVLLNLWYALILFSFSQTRENILEKREAKDEKPLLEVFVADIKNSLVENFDMERMMRKYTPGLHARTMEKWRRAETKVSRRRERRMNLEQERTRSQQLDRAKSGWSLMPFNRTLEGGSTLNRPGSLLGIGDTAIREEANAQMLGGPAGANEAASDVSDESLDLGPLSPTRIHAQKKWKKRMGLDEPIRPPVEDLESAIQSLGTQILDRVKHIGIEVKDEMEETKEVLMGIKDVIQVVNRRVKDLDIV